MSFLSLRSFVLALALGVLAGCSDEPRSATVLPDTRSALCDNAPATSLDAVFAGHFASTTPTGCTAGCHESGTGGLTFRDASSLWQATVNHASSTNPAHLLVEPGWPERSELYLRLLPDAAIRMPQGGPYLDDAALRDVAGWICAGAPQPFSTDGGTPATDGGTGNPQPRLDSVTPPSVLVGAGEVSVALNGASFLSSSKVLFDGTSIASTFTNASRLDVLLPAAISAEAGTHRFQVTNPAPGGGTSNSLPLSVLAPNPVPTVSSLSPCGMVANGSAFTLTVNGSGFVSGASVTFNGSAVTANLVSASQLQLSIPGSLVVSAPADNAAAVVVTNPAPGGGASAPAYFGVATKVSTLAGNVQTIFDQNCNSGCHSTGGTPVNLTSTRAYAELVGVPSSACSPELRVLACGPLRSQSVLIDKILATNTSLPCSGSPMPKGGTLSAADKQTLVDWVAQGAPQK